jgi:hypothetical protein
MKPFLKDAKNEIVLIYDWSMRRSEYKSLKNAIDKMNGVEAILISQKWFEMSADLKKDDCYQIDKVQLFWDKFCKSISNYNGDYPEIFANPHLLFQFDGIKKEMAKASTYSDGFSLILNLINPSMVIFAHEAFTIERALVGIARNKSIPTVSLFHGGYGPKIGFRGISGIADFIWVWSKTDVDSMKFFGVDSSRLKKIGCVRYEEKYTTFCDKKNKNSKPKKNNAKILIGGVGHKPLITILSAAINTGFASPVGSPRLHRDAIRSFLELVKVRQDLQFVIKAHPGYDYNDLYSCLVDQNLPNLLYDEKLKLDEVLNASDICIMFNYFTTAALDAMLSNVPIIYFDNATYPLTGWQDNFIDAEVSRVNNIKELECVLDDLLLNAGIRKKALSRSHRLIMDSLGIEEFTASERLSLAIKSTLESKQRFKARNLGGKKVIKDFLYSNTTATLEYRDSLKKAYSSHLLMHVISTLSGSFNLRITSISRIFIIFNNNANSDFPKNIRFKLLQAYVEGFNNGPNNGISLNWLGLLIFFLINPRELLAASSYFRRQIVKYLVFQLVGKKSINFFLNLGILKKRNF